jgi:lysophospholipase L1-like esterase
LKIKILLSCWLLLTVLFARAQQLPFYNDVQKLKRNTDSIVKTETEKSIVFIGSSSFTMWHSLQADLPEYKIINNAFGGSTLLDVIRYVDDIIPEKHTKQIVVYCGENDLAADSTVTGEIVAQRFEQLFHLLRKKIKNVPILYVSMKPSPSRVHLMDKMETGNKLISYFLKKQKNRGYINVFNRMLKEDGTVMDDIFLQDRLHMNKAGYAIWIPLLKNGLAKYR